MAYNPYFQNLYFQGYPQQQTQSSGFVSVRNIEEAMRYPVAPGNSVTFKDETSPYVYTKTMGFSQLDRPIFEKYRLVKEESAEPPKNEPSGKFTEYALKSDCRALQEEIESLKRMIKEIKDHESNANVSAIESESGADTCAEVQRTFKLKQSE